MLVAELIAPREFRLAERPIEDPGPGEVQVRVDAVGICGSDLHSYSEGGVGDTPCQLPHGARARTRRHRSQDRRRRHRLGARRPRRARTRHLLLSLRILPQRPAQHLRQHPLPEHSRQSRILPRVRQSARREPARHSAGPFAGARHHRRTTGRGHALPAVRAASNPAKPSPSSAPDPSDCSPSPALKVAGAGRIWAVDPVAHRRELARHMGADAVLDPARSTRPARSSPTPPAAAWIAPSIAPPRRTPPTPAIRASRNGGRVVLTGIHSASMVPFEVSPMRRKELAIFNVRRSNHESHDALALLTSPHRLVRPPGDPHPPIACHRRCLHLTEHYADGVGKMVIV